MPHLGPRRLTLSVLVEAVGIVAVALTLAAWFGAWPSWLSPGQALFCVLVLAATRIFIEKPRLRLPSPHGETIACLALAVAYRVPALLHPWGWVNRDGAYGAFVALHLLEGARPAPVFTEGANYQGTLKAHVAALVGLGSRAEDLSFLMVVSTTLLYLVFLAATMAIARRLGGRAAALVAGLYLALSPRFVTVFSLNCTGQYVDILALGMLALALVARVLDGWPSGFEGRLTLLSIGLLCGAALWQQPAALPFVAVALGLLLLRGPSWRSASSVYLLLGLGLGLLPPLLWNLRNGWATSSQVAYNPVDSLARVTQMPELAAKTVSLAFPLLGGLAHSDITRRPSASLGLGLLFPTLLVVFLLLEAGGIIREARRWRPSAALLMPLLFTATVLVVWTYASGSAYSRPRYLLPVVGAFAVFLGVAFARAWSSAKPIAALAALAVASLLYLNVSGSIPRMARSALVASSFEPLLRSLDEKGVRTGYSDFSLSAPVTMFTRERITLSASLGPTPAYYSPRHERRVRERGPDAFILLPTDDIEAFRASLDGLGITYRFDPEPYPTFFSFSRRLRLEEVVAVAAPQRSEDEGGEE